ncbi:MAG TPA: ABC transporter substrate binding protein, partial [Candidatus Sulfotelmatobacter sp.]|nr:ABC transporter substrate binding protein [Candidatus Sulfotelmatobacter sp.]
EGGLISYGIDLRWCWYHLATFVDRILKGASPADLPVEFPTKLEMVINLTAAKALALQLPFFEVGPLCGSLVSSTPE